MMREEEERMMLSKLWFPYLVDSGAIDWNLEADVEEGEEDKFAWRWKICIYRSGIQ